MFGYVSPLKDELEDEQYNVFRSYYCGVCKQMSAVSRMALSFECAFIACTMGSYDDAAYTKRKICPANPFRRRDMVLNETTAYAADINTILAYHKILDDIHDDGKLRYRLARLMMHRAYRKACGRRTDVARLVSEALDRLNGLEQQGCSSSDMIAHEFAELFQHIAAYERPLATTRAGGIKNPDATESNAADQKEATHMGEDIEARQRLFYNLGRWIYLIDALADYSDDIKQGNYNVLALEWGDYQQALEAMDFSLWHTLSEAELAMHQLHLGEGISTIVENVVAKSLPVTTMATLCKGGLKPEPV